ncbi:MAG: copper chaperone PCu(A)C [Aquabacterium sp.]|jgi:copper(I)-binding protein|uniref:copper chaperone PCu(A)C n=1 Tax=Aquabacterium sp. TaxID=1872578 RepID=UPI002A35E047|nr:copper chaperone PCu(A)C [Aquabacterium sp.]MDX9845116.1 copper chaperone PCu(A)C [Aquabacterium sp.]
MSRSTRLLSRAAFTTLALSLSIAGGVTHAAGPADTAGKKAATAPAAAPWVQVDSAWVRPMVPGQTATGGFMVLTARQALTLEGFSMTRAGVPELHEMTMDGQVMRMRAISSLALPAGQAVVLRPGGHHLMLTQLQESLKAGDVLSLTLKLRTADGQAVTQTVNVPVRAHMMMPANGAGTPAPMQPGSGGHHHHGMSH